MSYNGISYAIGEGLKNVFKNKKSTVISVITMMCTMFLFGMFFAIGVNVNSILEQIQLQQGMEVFIYDSTTDEQKAKFEESIKELDGVNTTVFKTKQQALDSMKEQLKDKQDLLKGYEGENNIFPASFIVTLTDLEKSKEIQDEIRRIGAAIAAEEKNEFNVNAEQISDEENAAVKEIENKENTIVKEITDKDGTITALIIIARTVRIAIGIIFIILLIGSVTIISNTIRLTVHARRKEISIMKYVGATDSFIRWPFIVEGILIGLIAALITLLFIGILYDIAIQKIESFNVLQKMGITLLGFVEIAKPVAIVYAILGIGIGIVGSSVSMKKYLEV